MDGGERAADVLIIVAGDDRDDVACEVRRVRNLVEAHGATFVGQDEGKARRDGLVGHEHFGFLDGISQPGLRGRASEDPTDVLTPRQNRADPGEGKPGQELIWPGEFVFGYPAQVGSRDGVEPGGDASFDGAGSPQVPAWGQGRLLSRLPPARAGRLPVSPVPARRGHAAPHERRGGRRAPGRTLALRRPDHARPRGR